MRTKKMPRLSPKVSKPLRIERTIPQVAAPTPVAKMSRTEVLSMRNRRLKKMPQASRAKPLSPGDPLATNVATQPGPNGVGNTIETNTNYTMGQEDRVVLVVQNGATITLPTEPLLGFPVYIVADGGVVNVVGPIYGGNATLPQGSIGIFAFSSISGEWSESDIGETGATGATGPAGTSAAGVPNIASLRLVIGTTNEQIAVGGYHSLGDDGGGVFYWDPSSSSGDNGGTIIVPTGSSTGRWLRISTEPFNVKQFGAYGDNVHDDTASIQSTVNAATATSTVVDGYVVGGATIFFPPGIYKISSDIVIPAGLGGSNPNLNPANVILQGSGRLSTFIQAVVPGVNCFSQQYAQSVAVLTNVLIQDMTLSTSVSTSTWTANTNYTVGQTVTNGCSPFVHLCTSSGTSGTHAPFGQMFGQSGTDPIITLSGTPTAQFSQIVIVMNVGGPLSTAEFQYSTNAGQTFNGTNIPTASSVALGSTGLTAHFSAGTYTQFTELYNAGAYYSGQIGYALSQSLGEVIQDNTVTWEVVGGSGFLQVDGSRVTIQRVDFLNLPTGLTFDGTETSTVEDCNFLSLNGIWVTGDGIRTGTSSDSVPNGFYCSNCNFNCSQINLSLTVCESGELENVNFESGICAIWVASCDLIEINTLLSEGVSTGLVVGQSAPYIGTYLLSSFSITVKNSLINPNGSSAPYGNAFQFVPNVNDPTFQVITPYEHLSLFNCQISTPSNGYAFLGSESGNGLRLIDTIFNQPQAQWFNNGAPTHLVVEESGNAISGPSQLGIGVVPSAVLDVLGGTATRAAAVSLVSGQNNNVATQGYSYIEINGPTAAFNITGFAGGTSGLEVDLYNLSGHQMTINFQNESSVAANRVITSTSADVAWHVC